jgi:hypothetical protein
MARLTFTPTTMPKQEPDRLTLWIAQCIAEANARMAR